MVGQANIRINSVNPKMKSNNKKALAQLPATVINN